MGLRALSPLRAGDNTHHASLSLHYVLSYVTVSPGYVRLAENRKRPEDTKTVGSKRSFLKACNGVYFFSWRKYISDRTKHTL